MAKDADWGKRLRQARADFEGRQDHKRLPYRQIGERVGELLGREPFEYTTVRAWFVDGQEPESFVIAKALAAALEVDIATLLPDLPATPKRRTAFPSAKPTDTPPHAKAGQKRDK